MFSVRDATYMPLCAASAQQLADLQGSCSRSIRLMSGSSDNERTSAPSRVLWAGIGAVGTTAIVGVGALVAAWHPDIVSAYGSIVGSIASAGLLATAAWAGSVGVATMKINQRSARAAEDASTAAMESSRAAKAANVQAEKDSHRANRPYVGVQLVAGLAGTTEFDVRIKNYGRSAATHLTIECVSELERKDHVTEAVREMFETPRTLYPGESLRAMWQLGDNEGKTIMGEPVATPHKKEGMPDEATLVVRYQDATEEEVFSETVNVRWVRSGLWPVPERGATPKEGPHELPHLVEATRALARHVGDLNR